MRGCLLLAFVALLGVAIQAAVAADAPVAGAVSPGQIEKRFESPKLPQSKPGPLMPELQTVLPPEKAEQIHFQLKKILVQGSSVFSEKELSLLSADLLDKEISLLDLYRVRDAITAKYRNAGYLLSQAVIPAQEIKEGVAYIQIVDSVINNINIQGDTRGGEKLIRAYAEKIRASHPLRADDIERYVMLMNDLPGLIVRTVLTPTPGDTAGSDLTFIVESHPLTLTLGADNRGTTSVGPDQVYYGAETANLLGNSDRTSISGVVTTQVKELNYVDVRHIEPLGSEGLLASVDYTHTRTQPGGELKPLDLISNGDSYELGLKHPLLRSRSRSLFVNAAVKVRDEKVDVLGRQFSKDKIRTLSVGTDYDVADRLQGRNLFSLQFSQGLNTLGATKTGSPTLSRANGRSDFFKATASALRLQPLAAAFSASLAVQAQWSADPLLSSEQFAVGGAQFGRGFNPSGITGDSGAAARFELQYQLPLSGPKFGGLTVFASTDGGTVQRNQRGLEPRHNTLVSAGGGLRYEAARYFSGSLEADKPIRSDFAGAAAREWRVFFTANVRY